MLVALLLAGCTTPTARVLDESFDGRTASVKLGDTLTVRLASNRSTGYRWGLLKAPTPVLAPAGDAGYATDDSAAGRTGAPGHETWRFVGAAPGSVRLRLGYARPWETNAAPAREFTVTVTVW